MTDKAANRKPYNAVNEIRGALGSVLRLIDREVETSEEKHDAMRAVLNAQLFLQSCTPKGQAMLPLDTVDIPPVEPQLGSVRTPPEPAYSGGEAAKVPTPRIVKSRVVSGGGAVSLPASTTDNFEFEN